MTKEQLIKLIQECEQNPSAFPELEAALEQIPDDEKAELDNELSIKQQEALKEAGDLQSDINNTPAPTPKPVNVIKRLRELEEGYEYDNKLRHVLALSRLVHRMTPEQVLGLGQEFEALGLDMNRIASSNAKVLHGFYQSYLGRGIAVDPSLMNAMVQNMPSSSRVKQFQDERNLNAITANFPSQVNALLANPSASPSQYLQMAMQLLPKAASSNDDQEQKKAGNWPPKPTPFKDPTKIG